MKHLVKYEQFNSVNEQKSLGKALKGLIKKGVNVVKNKLSTTKSKTAKTKKITPVKPVPKYRLPEFEFKEFYRVFKNFPELQKMLPKEIDRKIFKIKADGFEGEPSWFFQHLDPPGAGSHEGGGKFDTVELLKKAMKEDPRFIPFIEYTQKLFKGGNNTKMGYDEVVSGLDNKFLNHDWHDIKKDPDFLTKGKEAAEQFKKVAPGESMNQTGLVKRFPDIDIPNGIAWDTYFGGTMNYLDKTVKAGIPLPTTQFIVKGGKYYTVGGRRRMFWHFLHKLDPTVYLINL